MPRTARLLVDNGCYHLLTRGNNRAAVFHEPADYQHYGQLLLEYLPTHGMRLYHYCLMTNHVHLVVEAATAAGLRKAMQGINLRYALAYKRRYPHTGHFWQDRFKSLLIAKDAYLLQCGAYVELNPVRARMVPAPEAYPWSSARAYATGGHDPLITLNPLYLALGPSPTVRQVRYRAFVQAYVAPTPMPGQSQRALGSSAFLEALAERVGQPLVLRPRGRPRKRVTSPTS